MTEVLQLEVAETTCQVTFPCLSLLSPGFKLSLSVELQVGDVKGENIGTKHLFGLNNMFSLHFLEVNGWLTYKKK